MIVNKRLRVIQAETIYSLMQAGKLRNCAELLILSLEEGVVKFEDVEYVVQEAIEIIDFSTEDKEEKYFNTVLSDIVEDNLKELPTKFTNAMFIKDLKSEVETIKSKLGHTLPFEDSEYIRARLQIIVNCVVDKIDELEGM